jgi:hypothetical protein
MLRARYKRYGRTWEAQLRFRAIRPQKLQLGNLVTPEHHESLYK